MADSFLEVEDLTLHYGGSKILHEVSLAAPLGEVSCVMGTNGVGKTSLLKAISGTHARTSGRVVIDGEETDIANADTLARLGIAYVPQGREIFPYLSVQENLEIGFACLPKSKWEIPNEIFQLFPILSGFLHRRGGDLSGGQQQQLAIARALVTQPKILLLDEPTEGIQPNIIKQIGEVVLALRDRGNMAIVLVEQYFDFAHQIGDRFTVLERGQVTLQGRKNELDRDLLLSAVSV